MTFRRRWGTVAILASASALALPAPAAAASDVLPDLAMARIDYFKIETTSSGKVRLRFPTVIGNRGVGWFRLRLQRANTSQAEMSVKQRIKNNAGGYRTVSTPAKAFYSGDGHNHWHVRALQLFELVSAANGNRHKGAKTGFCFYDNTKWDLSLPGAPQSPYYSHCGSRSSLAVTMNLSVGWGDEYPYNIAFQYVDITTVPSGNYRLEVTADPSNHFIESNNSNNKTWTDIKIDKAAKTVQILAFDPTSHVLP
jgi:hypothetical protein